MYEQLVQLLNQASIALQPPQQQQLLNYLTLLDRWNQAYNLTAVRDRNEMLTRHIMDSLVVMPWLSGQRLIDVGTGAGLPGIPLAIAMPHTHFTLLDSLGKRIRFLHQVQHQLQLKNVTVIQSRVEAFSPELKFDGVLSRAFASLADMVSWCQHLLQESGNFYALKGQINTEEIRLLPPNIQVKQTIELHVPALNAKRHLLIITKNS